MTRCLVTGFAIGMLVLGGCRATPPPSSTSAVSAANGAPVLPAVPEEWPFPLTRPAAEGEHGMVVSDQALATDVGVAVLAAGGNAVDAAVATAFALAVVLPSAGNIGGGGFMVAHMAGESHALDFRETAPAAATRDMYLDARGETGDRPVTGHLASGVPASVAGLWEAHRRFGTQPWAALIAPAIRLAHEGFAVDDYGASVIAAEAERLRRFPASAALYTPGGQPLRSGAQLRNPALGRTLERIAEAGRDGFYKGETAALLLAEMRRGQGIITAADLEAYQPKWRAPIAFRYRGHEVVSMPPPSSGGITLALIAQQLTPYDLTGLGWHSARSVHLMAESMRRAFAVRNEVIADPDVVPFDQAALLAPAFSDALRRTISTERATPSSEVQGRPAPAERRQTTHFSVTDSAGNAVALTTTINGWYGSAVTVADAGFLLNNEMDDFAARPGTPNMYGLVQGEANAIAPGKRMLSAMTPTIVLDGEAGPLMVTGASGGPFIITTVFQAISNRLDYGLGASGQMQAPRLHHQHLPDALRLEQGGFAAADIAELRRLGHEVRFFSHKNDGSIGAVIERRNGRWYGQSDPRLSGLAKGY